MSLPTGCSAYRLRIVFTIEVTGWFSANQRTGPGMFSVGTNAELRNGRNSSGYAKPPAPSVVLAASPAMMASHVRASVKITTMPTTASQASTPAPDRKPITSATSTTSASETKFATSEVST